MIDPASPGGLPPFDPLRPGFLADPYRAFDEYRLHDPVHWNGHPSGRRAGRWYVFDYRSAVTVLTDKRFGRQPLAPRGACPAASGPCAHAPAAPPVAPPPVPRSFSTPGPFAAMTANWMLFQDPPKHTRMRLAVSPAFTVAAAHALRSRIEQRVQELLAPLAGQQRFDLLREFAFPLPLDVIADVLGVDASERAAFRSWSAAMRNAVDRPKWGTDALAQADAATLGLNGYFEDAWRRHRTAPGHGVLSALFRLEGRDDGLSKEEAFAMFTFLISAGHETTTNLICSGMYLFAQHPRERQRLLDEPALIQRTIEEILRYESPVQAMTRIVAADVELGTRKLLAGDRVEVLVGSANRDPAVFEAPERFDAGRKPNAHLAFGLGSHYCVGAPLARLMASIALPVLLQRVQVLEFAPATTPWTASVGFRGLKDLPCAFREQKE